MTHVHQITRCKRCRAVLSTCRCIGPKVTVWQDGPCSFCRGQSDSAVLGIAWANWPTPGDTLPRLTTEQAAILGAFTGVLLGRFEDLHEYIERILGRPVWTHELASPEVVEVIKVATRPDLMRILPEEARL